MGEAARRKLNVAHQQNMDQLRHRSTDAAMFCDMEASLRNRVMMLQEVLPDVGQRQNLILASELKSENERLRRRLLANTPIGTPEAQCDSELNGSSGVPALRDGADSDGRVAALEDSENTARRSQNS